MGFRDPLTSISGDDITPGTITGSVFQTAAAGARVRIDDERVDWYTGDPDEAGSGYLRVGVDQPGLPGSRQGFLELSPPQISDLGAVVGPGTSLRAFGQRADLGSTGGWLMDGDLELSGRATTSEPDQLATGETSLYAAGWSPGPVAGVAPRLHARRFTTAFTAGSATVTWGPLFPTAIGGIVAMSGVGPGPKADLTLTAQNLSTTGCQLIVRDAAGAALSITLTVFMLVWGW